MTFDFAYFLEQLRPDTLLWQALWTTVYVSVIAQVAGTVLGIVTAIGALSRYAPLRLIAGIYVWIFRGTPLLVQIAFWYFGVQAIPRVLELGPFVIPGAVIAGTIALAVNEGAYMSEIVRAGILSVDEGQTEAALVVGLTESQAMRSIVLPQAARLIIPGLGNEFNNMLKNSSLISTIGVTELFRSGQNEYARSFNHTEVLLGIALWYLLLTTVWQLVQVQIERRLGRHERRSSEPFLARLLGAGQRLRTYS